MNKGLQAHIVATVLYILPLLLVWFSIDNEAKSILVVGYFAIQLGIAIMAYLEDWYNQ